MINTSTLQTLRRVADATSPQGDVLAMPPFEATPVPLYVEGWKGGLDCVHAGAPWSIPLFEMTVGRLTAVTGDGKPGFDRENPKRNVYELHLVPDDPAQLTPLKRLVESMLIRAWSMDRVFPEATAAREEFAAFERDARTPFVAGGIIIKQNVYVGGQRSYVPIWVDGVERTGAVEIQPGDRVRADLRPSGYQVHADSFGISFRFGPRGIHVVRQHNDGGGDADGVCGAPDDE
jgi:hypothetical protein